MIDLDERKCVYPNTTYNIYLHGRIKEGNARRVVHTTSSNTNMLDHVRYQGGKLRLFKIRRVD